MRQEEYDEQEGDSDENVVGSEQEFHKDAAVETDRAKIYFLFGDCLHC